MSVIASSQRVPPPAGPMIISATEEAARNVSADYATETPSANLDSPGTQTIPAVGHAQRLKADPQHGDFAQAYASADVKLDAEYRTPTQTHNPIELFSTTAAWSDTQLTIYEPTQSVYGLRAEVARQLNMDPGKVRVISPYIGGAFGSKGATTPRTAIVALAAKRLNRPVRCIVSRAQDSPRSHTGRRRGSESNSARRATAGSSLSITRAGS